ncbi:MAG: L-histidine N(alpha)-methyltransferase [Pseudomonadota bacterium]
MADGDGSEAGPDPDFLREAREGLAKTPKSLSSKWLYDQRGSELFEQITKLDEYYPTRTETAILKAYAPEIAAAIGPGAVVVEYGAGAAIKTRLVLDALEAPEAYAPQDISEEFLKMAAATLAADYPNLHVVPLVGNFLEPLDLSGLPNGRRCGFFPGSTIGNLSDAQIRSFFQLARESLGPDARFLLGFDLRKSPDILVPAYDDADGVTAMFIVNLLTRMNRELGADFDPDGFVYQAEWNDDLSQIEMSIRSVRNQSVSIAGQSFDFADGETLLTSVSRKFTPETLARIVGEAGWTIDQTWFDERQYFGLALLA